MRDPLSASSAASRGAVRYSKPLGDIAEDLRRWLPAEAELRDRQRRHGLAALATVPREACLVCGSPLDGGEIFSHRGVDYVETACCGHVQSLRRASAGPAEGGLGFAEIYRPLPPAEFSSRIRRIYRPKLDWMLGAAEAAGLGREQLLASRWLELGCGGGAFLGALRAAGARQILGVEACGPLAASARAALAAVETEGEGTAPVVRDHAGSLAEAVRAEPADVYAAWFVLEHVEDAPALWAALRERPAGTLFGFAVPVMGLSTLLESAVDLHSARSLDSMVHQQLYTDRSIRRALDLAGYRVIGEWVFGQDAQDLLRLLTVELSRRYPGPLRDRAVAALTAAAEPLQEAIDRARLADARHVLAIRDRA